VCLCSPTGSGIGAISRKVRSSKLRDANNEEDSKSLDYLCLALAALQPLKLNSQTNVLVLIFVVSTSAELKTTRAFHEFDVNFGWLGQLLPCNDCSSGDR
jgi:hypothetical protein